MDGRRPRYVVPIRVENDLAGKAKTYSVSVYGKYSNEWQAQAAAAAKFHHVRRDWLRYGQPQILWGNTFIDHPKRLATQS